VALVPAVLAMAVDRSTLLFNLSSFVLVSLRSFFVFLVWPPHSG
jgi:hypothetical protein